MLKRLQSHIALAELLYTMYRIENSKHSATGSISFVKSQISS